MIPACRYRYKLLSFATYIMTNCADPIARLHLAARVMTFSLLIVNCMQYARSYITESMLQIVDGVSSISSTARCRLPDRTCVATGEQTAESHLKVIEWRNKAKSCIQTTRPSSSQLHNQAYPSVISLSKARGDGFLLLRVGSRLRRT